jgi:hypothetical protein
MTTPSSKHTPGPWKWAKSRGMNAYEIHGADGSYIGDVWGVDEPVPNGIKREHQKPNARLIAAAPEMLEALRDVLEMIATDDLVPESVSYMQQARAAIAKAEGR